MFLAYKGALDVSDDELYQTLELARELGVVVAAHCENAELVARRQQMLLAQGKTGPGFHEPSRPVGVEAEGTHHFASFVEMTGAHGYVVHLSNAASLEAALAAKLRGVSLTIESVIPHLILDESYAQRPDFEGAKYVMSPPLRTKADQAALWRALEHGLIDTVGTDHAPFDFHGQKDMGKDDFTKIPNGIPAIEDRVNLLYTYGVSRGALDIHRFVDAASTRAAKTFGLFPRKGTVAVGSDGDLVVYDPTYRGNAERRQADHDRRLQRIRRHGDRRPPERRHGAREGRRPRWRLRRRPQARPHAPAAHASPLISPPDVLIPEEEAILSSRSEPTPVRRAAAKAEVRKRVHRPRAGRAGRRAGTARRRETPPHRYRLRPTRRRPTHSRWSSEQTRCARPTASAAWRRWRSRMLTWRCIRASS